MTSPAQSRSVPMPDRCRCQHIRARHELPGFDGECVADSCRCRAFRPLDEARVERSAVAPTTQCTGCGQTKPRTEFYARGDDTSKVSPKCRDCDNARVRTRTVTRVVRVRARHRAVAELTRRHSREFRDLLDYYTKIAHDEAQQLATTPAATETYGQGQTVRLRPGQRRPGQSTKDRIDVARCTECVGYHDRGHVCASCGQAPEASESTIRRNERESA